jgi:hypothetical protein
MLFVSFVRWWYGLGWHDQVKLVRDRIDNTADRFSLGLTLRTFFQPFRQIDAGGVSNGPLSVVLRAMFDQLFSRFFGAILRSLLIIVGAISIGLEILLGGVRLVIWPLIPVAPVLSIIPVFSGWMPWL